MKYHKLFLIDQTASIWEIQWFNQAENKEKFKKYILVIWSLFGLPTHIDNVTFF